MGIGSTRPNPNQVYYDPSIGYYTSSRQPLYAMGQPFYPGGFGIFEPLSSYSPALLKQMGITVIGNPLAQESGLYGKNLNQGPTKPLPIPSYMPAGLQVYGSEPVTPAARPTPQARPGVAPQFDMSFLQQLMAQRAQQPAAPAGPPTLTPGAMQTYGGSNSMGGGLAALRAIAAPTTGV